jgi:hypothetical protein
MMPTLRDGLKVNDEPLTADELDGLAHLSPEECDETVPELLKLIENRARLVCAAGLEGQLTLDELSQYEIVTLGLVRKRERQRERDIFVALLASALGAEDAHKFLPDDDEDLARIKWEFDLAKRAWAKLDGVGGGGALTPEEAAKAGILQEQPAEAKA